MKNNIIGVVILLCLCLCLYYYYSTEKLVTETDWMVMSRGFSASNKQGYADTIRTLSQMEKSKGDDIITNNRSSGFKFMVILFYKKIVLKTY